MTPPTDDPRAAGHGRGAGRSGAARILSAVPRWAAFAAGGALGALASVAAASALGLPLLVAVPVALVAGLLGVAALTVAQPHEGAGAPTAGGRMREHRAEGGSPHGPPPPGEPSPDEGRPWLTAIVRVVGPLAVFLVIGIGIGIGRGIVGDSEPAPGAPSAEELRAFQAGVPPEAVARMVVRPKDLSATGLPHLVVADGVEGPGTDFLQVLPFVPRCVVALRGVSASWERVMDVRGDLPAVYHSVALFDSVEAARTAMEGLRAAAGECPGGDGETAAVAAPPSPLGDQTVMVLRIPDDDPVYVSSVLLATRHGSVVHAVNYVPTVLRRVDLPSDTAIDEVGRAADRRVREGLPPPGP